MKTNSQRITGQITLTFVALLMLIAVSVNLRAATITVTNTADSGAGTLRAALASAVNGDTINFSLPTPSKITLTSGELLVTKNLNILGPGAGDLSVDGNHAGRVFHVQSNILVTIAGLTITNGFIVNFYGGDRGGGILNERATLAVNDCALKGNAAQNYGGGIFNDHGNLVVSNSTLIDNSATAYNGGAIYNFGSFFDVSDHIVATNGANLRIVNSLVSGSVPDAIYQFSYRGTANVQIVNCALNEAAGLNIFNWSAGLGSSATVDIIGSTVSKSQGAIMIQNFDGVGAILSITNCTLSGNTTSGGITAIKNGGGSILRIVNSTISVNSDDILGSSLCINNGGSAEIGSTLLNAGATGFSFYDGGIVTSLGYNLCSDDARGHFLTNATDLLNTDPILGPLQDNGGSTMTHALLPGSPGIDQGKNFSASTTDQRGWPRTFNVAGIPNAAGGDATDIGAVESQDASLRLGNFGVISNQYGFKLTGPLTNVVVEASTNLVNWTPLVTNTLGDAVLRFNDPAAPASPKRFYRLRVQ